MLYGDEGVDEVLAHFGVKGMKWGVRRKTPTGPTDVIVTERPGKRVKTSGGKGQRASGDAVRAAINRQKAKKSSTDSLSTQELQELVNRMNLEQQYSRLGGGSSLEKGQKFVKDLLGLGKTVQEVRNFTTTSSVAKDIGALLKR